MRRCCHREIPSGGSLSAHTGNHSVIRTREDRALTTSATGRGTGAKKNSYVVACLAHDNIIGHITLYGSSLSRISISLVRFKFYIER